MQRLQEAKARVAALPTTNTYEFIQADLTTMAPETLAPCDILISRFVLSHLPDAFMLFNRFIRIVRPGGYICTEECASDAKEYFCNTQDPGYLNFIKLIALQCEAQKSVFDIGFHLLSNAPGKVLHSHITQPILRSARHKSIFRLGLEEAKAATLKGHDVEGIIRLLKQFEQDEKVFGLYTRFLAMICTVEHF